MTWIRDPKGAGKENMGERKTGKDNQGGSHDLRQGTRTKSHQLLLSIYKLPPNRFFAFVARFRRRHRRKSSPRRPTQRGRPFLHESLRPHGSASVLQSPRNRESLFASHTHNAYKKKNHFLRRIKVETLLTVNRIGPLFTHSSFKLTQKKIILCQSTTTNLKGVQAI